MFAVDHVLISDAVLDAPFAYHVSQCLGGCCVHGDHGAPLEPDERERLEAARRIVERKLRPEALEAIAREGVLIEKEPGKYGTTTVAGRECVFVTYDKAVAKCAPQQAYNAGRLEFEKPTSCRLISPSRGDPRNRQRDRRGAYLRADRPLQTRYQKWAPNGYPVGRPPPQTSYAQVRARLVHPLSGDC